MSVAALVATMQGWFPSRGWVKRPPGVGCPTVTATIASRELVGGTMTAFAYSVDKGDSQAIVHLAGEIDLAAAPGLEAAIEAVMEDADDVVLDIAEVSFLDSSGLRVLVAAHTSAGESGKTLTMVNPSPAVSRILEITGLSGVLLPDD